MQQQSVELEAGPARSVLAAAPWRLQAVLVIPAAAIPLQGAAVASAIAYFRST